MLIAVGLGLAVGAWAFLRGKTNGVAADDGASCFGCHEEVVTRWRHGGHHSLGCDVCHGPPGDHVVATADPRPHLLIKGPEHCLQCHLRQEGEPDQPPRIMGLAEHLAAIEKKHVTKVDRESAGKGCTFCHEPHALE